MAGRLYGVGVGPGDPELLTLQAVRILREVPVIAAPRTRGEKNLALDIAGGAVDLSQKEILYLEFLMVKDPDQLEQSHRRCAEQILPLLEQGKDVAMLNLGDPSLYGTYGYIQRLVEQAGFETVTVPGIPSFCAVAAQLGRSLTVMDKPLHIIPAGHGGLEQTLPLEGTKVLMKTGRAMAQVKEALRSEGCYQKAALVENCCLPNQRICRTMDEVPDDTGYVTTILIGE